MKAVLTKVILIKAVLTEVKPAGSLAVVVLYCVLPPLFIACTVVITNRSS